MKWIDIPPLWLLLAVVITWWIGQAQPDALRFDGTVLYVIGTLLVGAGIVLILLAATEMRKKRTTIVPHMDATHLVETGIFGRSRNPIYLGDVLVLAGLALRWGTPVALLLVPAFMWVITRRFIIPEETRLRTKFGGAFDTYCQKTRRWL